MDTPSGQSSASAPDLTSGSSSGLTEVEAQSRLTQDGPNELPRKPPRSVWRIAFQVIREPMFLLLLAAGVIYLFLGDWVEALILLGAVVATAMISIVQEKRTDNVLASLRDLASPRALVVRDGQQKRIAGSEVVCGDVIVLAEGNRIPADAQMLSGNNLQVDESLLTGESVAVDKLLASGEDAPHVFSGSLVVRRHGLAHVFATGINSELGKIGKALGDIPEEPTRLHAQTRQLVKLFGTMGLVLSVLVVLFYGLQRGDWLAGALSGTTLTMAIGLAQFEIQEKQWPSAQQAQSRVFTGGVRNRADAAADQHGSGTARPVQVCNAESNRAGLGFCQRCA
jgi:P-type Ca2+ transporter type 2C